MIKQLSQLFGVAAFLSVSGHPVQATTHQDVILGGVNLTPWCQKQYGNGFKAKLTAKTAGDWTCEKSGGRDRRPILVSKACILQYGSKAYKAKALNWQDPYSWKCLGKQAGPTAASASAADRCDTLESGQAAFFEHSRYRGACFVRNVGRYSNSRSIGIGNDKISSIKVGFRTLVKLCKDNNFRGGCSTYTKSTPSLGGMNDKTSSAIISRARISLALCTPKAYQVAVYADVDYRGQCNVLGVDSYINSRRIGVADDTISSVFLGPGAQIRLCEDKGFTGGCRTYTNRWPSLGQMNDKTSSAIVSRKKILTARDRCKPKANQIVVFEHVDYKGACSVLGVGSYGNSRRIGVANDTISSVLVGRNAAIVGFTNNNFNSINFYSDRNTPRIVGRGLGDAISSLKVVKTR